MTKDLIKKHLDLVKLKGLTIQKGLSFLMGRLHKVEDGLSNIQLIQGEKGDSIVGPQGEKGEQGIQGEMGPPGNDGKDGLSIVGPQGSTGPQGPRGETGVPGLSITGPQGPMGQDGSPDEPAQVRDKLETLKGAERLSINAINDLQEKLDDLGSKVGKVTDRVQTPAKAYRVHLADVSAQCDGANKTFTVGGSHFGIIGVYGTEFPVNFRPIIDYTETRTGILLTSEVAAPALGQTLVVQYLK